MFYFTIKDVSLHTVIDRRRRKANGLFPVKVVVQCHGRQLYIPTGVDFDVWPEPSSPEAVRLKEIFDSVCLTSKTILLDNRDSLLHPKTQLQMIKSALKRPEGPAPMLDAYLEEKMRQCLNEGRINSFYRVRTTLHALRTFSADTPFEIVTPDFLRRFDKFLRRKGLSCTTINIYMKTLKASLNDAIEAGDLPMEAFPFGTRKYEPPQASQRKTALSPDQVAAIIAFRGTSSLELYRDLWLFSYLCNGINFRDMLFLRYSDINGSEITFVRAKTRHALDESRKIRAFITPEMRKIIERHGNPRRSGRNSFIFPFAHEKMTPLEISNMVRRITYLTNRALRRIAVSLDIPPFTTYSARHSFATILKRRGIDITYISECLGHTSLSTTETYLAGFDTDDRREYSKLLTNFRNEKF